MRSRHGLAIGIFLSAGLLLGPACAQAPAVATPGDPNNPPFAHCNLTSDTKDDNRKVPTEIDDQLLTSGQPCEPVVHGAGLTSSVLDNLQRGFDFYSWLTFIALNSPADGKIIGQGSGPGGDAVTRWEALDNYRPLADVMLLTGAKPNWGKRIVPAECRKLDGPGKIILKLGEAAWNQPFKTGPLIDQNGHYALFDILMNKPMFDYIDTNTLYTRQGQEAFENDVVFPEGDNVAAQDGNGHMGAVMLKVSWRILDPVKDKAVMSRYHTAQALIAFPGPLPNGQGTRFGPACVERTLGLIGFHVGHKTAASPQWVWSSFEQIDNAPNQQDVARSGQRRPPYTFYNASCPAAQCPPNHTPPDPWDPPTTLTFHSADRSQVVRTSVLPQVVADEVADLNNQFHKILKGTVWENYALLATQWPSDATSLTDCNGAPAPTFLANTTLETYSQGVVPLASSSCMACHGNATTQHNPATPSDFTFILEKARCANGVCPAAAAKLPAKPLQCGFTASAH